jgi:hypothetical protein
MSDFISRLAARAVGQATVAQPRPDVLLGEAEPEVAAEVALTEPSAEPPAMVHETVNRVERTVDHASLVRVTEPRVVQTEPARPLVERERVEARTLVATAGPTVEVQPTVRSERVERAPTVLAGVDAVAAVPLAAEALPPAPARAEREERPEPARVHIGRLEIRATVQEEPKPQPRRPAPRRSEALTLGDYLRGSR